MAFLFCSSVTYSQTIHVTINGFDDGITTTKQKDYTEAVLFAKREAIERAGCKIESFTTIENLILNKSYIESKANAILLPGFKIVDNGYSREGPYQVTLVAEVLIKNNYNEEQMISNNSDEQQNIIENGSSILNTIKNKSTQNIKNKNLEVYFAKPYDIYNHFSDGITLDVDEGFIVGFIYIYH